MLIEENLEIERIIEERKLSGYNSGHSCLTKKYLYSKIMKPGNAIRIAKSLKDKKGNDLSSKQIDNALCRAREKTLEI